MLRSYLLSSKFVLKENYFEGIWFISWKARKTISRNPWAPNKLKNALFPRNTIYKLVWCPDSPFLGQAPYSFTFKFSSFLKSITQSSCFLLVTECKLMPNFFPLSKHLGKIHIECYSFISRSSKASHRMRYAHQQLRMLTSKEGWDGSWQAWLELDNWMTG